MEEFIPIALRANADIVTWLIVAAAKRDLDLCAAVSSRRKELAKRQFFIRD
jgi:hypothetical protein